MLFLEDILRLLGCILRQLHQTQQATVLVSTATDLLRKLVSMGTFLEREISLRKDLDMNSSSRGPLQRQLWPL